jgi:2-hydroxy-3-keto-5-methylthiopentenyl-1-phosphate phosphatase
MFVGDGVSDECAVTQADIVMATSRLRQVCESKGIKHTSFDTFHEVLDTVVESITI